MIRQVGVSCMKKEDGFTLVELLVVIGVVGVLTGALVAVLNPVQFFKQGRDGRRLSDLTTIQSALEQYFSQNDSYPATGGVPFGSVWTSGGITYLKTVPNDPDSTATYEYCASGTPPSSYEVCATMEAAPLPSDCKPAAYAPCSKNCCLTNPF